MEREQKLNTSSASQRIVENDVPFKVDIYKLEGGDSWSLEVVTIRKGGAAKFSNGGSNIVPFKR